MVATWTEAFSSFTPAGTGWQNYDIYTNKSVPKGAIALIACGSVNDAAARTVGVRTDGSSLNRYVKLHEGEAGGGVFATMYVKVDASTGYIETYCDSTTGITFYLLGYWTGVGFTELFQALTISTASAWTDIDLSSYATDNRVVQVLLNNRQDGAAVTLGVRANGSSLTRSISVHEAESASAETTDGTCYSMCVKSDSGGVIEYYTSSTTTIDIILLGYFDDKINYTERMDTWTISATGWSTIQVKTLGQIDIAGRVCEVYCANAATGVEYSFGCRVNGSSLSRYNLIHESETNGNNGLVMACGTDTSANGSLQIYGSNAASEYFRHFGYFKPTEKDVLESETTGLADSVVVLPNKVVEADSISLAELIDAGPLPWWISKTDPATVASPSCTLNPLGRPCQKKVWKANGYYWVYGCESENYYTCWSSANRSSWSANTVYNFGGDYNAEGIGAFAYYCGAISGYDTYAAYFGFSHFEGSTGIYWRRGKCINDGTLTLETARTNTPLGVSSGTDKGVCTTAMDKSEYPHCGGITFNYAPDYYPQESVNASKDGSSGSYWPYSFLGASSIDWRNAVLVLPKGTSGQDMIAIGPNQTPTPDELQYFLKVSGTWDTSPTTIVSGLNDLDGFDAVEMGGNVYIIYLKTNGSNKDVCMKKYTNGSGLGSEETIKSNISGTVEVAISCHADGYIYAFWSQSGRYIYSRRRDASATWGSTNVLYDRGSGVTVQRLGVSQAVQDNEVSLAWVEGSSGSWTIKFGSFTPEPIAKLATDAISISDSIIKSPKDQVITDAVSLADFSLLFNYLNSQHYFTNGASGVEMDAFYQDHVFRTKEKYERVYLFFDTSQYFSAGCHPDFRQTTLSNFLSIDDHGAGASDDAKDDTFWDKANAVFRTAFLLASTHYMRLRTITPNQTPSVYLSSSGQTDIALSGSEVQDKCCCAYADGNYWFGYVQTSGGSGDKFFYVHNAATWGSTWGSAITVDASNGDVKAVRILPVGGATVKTGFLYVTGTTAGSYSIRMKYYSGGVVNIGQICSDLYAPNSWSAQTDEKGNTWIAYLTNSDGTNVKLVKVTGTSIGTAITVSSRANYWGFKDVALAVDLRCDRQAVFWSQGPETPATNYIYYRFISDGAPAGASAILRTSLTTDYYFWNIASEPHAGTYDIWVHSTYYSGSSSRVDLLQATSILNKYAADAPFGLAETIIAGLALFAKLAEDVIGLADVKYVGKGLVPSDAVALADAVLRPLLDAIAADSESLSDVAIRGVAALAAEGIYLADSVATVRFLDVIDAIALADSAFRNKEVLEAEVVQVADASLRGKLTVFLEEIYLVDAVLRGKQLVESDSIVLADTVIQETAAILKVVADSIGLTDLVLRGMGAIVLDGIALSDLIEAVKGRVAADGISDSDAILVGKAALLLDAILDTDAALTPLRNLLTADAAALADAEFLHKGAVALDVLSILDIVYRGKEVVEVDSTALADVVYKHLQATVAEGIVLADAFIRDKDLTVPEQIAIAELLYLDKTVIIDQWILLDDLVQRWITGLSAVRTLRGRKKKLEEQGGSVARVAVTGRAEGVEFLEGVAADKSITEGIVSRFDMETLVGGKLADMTGGNEGTLIGGIAIGQAEGVAGPGTFFDGIDDFINCGNDASMNTDAITVCLWAKLTVKKTWAMFISRGAWGAYYPWMFGQGSASTLFVELKGVGGNIEHNWNFIPTQGVWYHLAFTYDSVGGLKTYVNGNPNNSAPPKGIINNASAGTLTVGSQWWNFNHYSGILDEVLIYNRALSADEIKFVYEHPEGWTGGKIALEGRKDKKYEGEGNKG